MATEVVVSSVGDTHQLAPLVALEVETVLEVNRACRVVRALVLRNVELTHVLRVNAQVNEPVPAGVDPLVELLFSLVRCDEVLDLHLLELASTEDEVTRGNLVAECLTGLADTERWLHTSRGHNVLEVDEDTLSGLRTHVVQALLIVDRAEEGLHQTGEHLRLGPIARLTGLRVRNVCQTIGRRVTVLGLVGLQQVVSAVALVGVQRLHQRVSEGSDVTGSFPDLARQDNGGIQADDILTTGDEGLPPLALDVFLQLHTQGTVIPCRAGTAVNFTTRVNEPPALTQVGDGIDN